MDKLKDNFDQSDINMVDRYGQSANKKTIMQNKLKH